MYLQKLLDEKEIKESQCCSQLLHYKTLKNKEINL